MTTKELTEKYNITRQTLNNWVKKYEIPEPTIRKGHQNIWTSEQIELIDKKINQNRSEQVTLFDNESNSLHINNRRYLGSKQKMLSFINNVVKENTNEINVVADIFGGTGVVADLFRSQGKKVIVNDILTSNYVSYETWFGNEDVDRNKIHNIIKRLNLLEGFSGYVTQNFGNKYFSLDNAKKIDAIREEIENIDFVNGREKAFLLTSLLYAMDKVANTVGHFDAYRKRMDSYKPLVLRVPDINKNRGNRIFNEDANNLVRKIKADLVYIDTPYNSRGYESAYHVLENVIEWKKPEVEGVARKAINRKEKSSEYTKVRAPQAFEDLIMHIDARYILVSYNNMAKKGNARSNAKISNKEIISILEKRGEVQTFDTEFNVFTTGKSRIKDHKELLYLCKIDINKKSKKIIQPALNYTGSKHRLLPQLLQYFPQDYKRFVDLFAGGASVTVNSIQDNTRRSYLVNDIEKHVIEFYQYLNATDTNNVIEQVERQIEKYKLSNTAKNGYEFYGCNSRDGLSNYNKNNFLKLREDYNNNPTPILFYLLIIFGFNNQIRFNSKGEYNLPVGKRDFNHKMKLKLIEFSQALKNPNVIFSTLDFRDISCKEDDFIYADPPYLISTATYNENGGWSKKDEIDLYNYLDEVDAVGADFALSNVITHNGRKNNYLENWSSKYHVQVLDKNYNNSNYQSKAKNSKTVEVLVTNYTRRSEDET